MRGRAGNAGMPEGGPGLGETWQTAMAARKRNGGDGVGGLVEMLTRRPSWGFQSDFSAFN